LKTRAFSEKKLPSAEAAETAETAESRVKESDFERTPGLAAKSLPNTPILAKYSLAYFWAITSFFRCKLTEKHAFFAKTLGWITCQAREGPF
jgi:hypothetical protein